MFAFYFSFIFFIGCYLSIIILGGGVNGCLFEGFCVNEKKIKERIYMFLSLTIFSLLYKSEG